MYIKRIKIKNFRNYENLDLEFDENINIIYGKNAQGKTNLLEAIYISSMSKSHKNVKDNELIKFNEEEAHIKEEIIEKEKSFIIDIHIKKNKNKGIAINKKKVEKVSEFLGISNVVFFASEDLNIIKEGPNKRRKFLDLYICQLESIYVKYLSKYNKILNQRNNLLKELNIKKNKELYETLDIWDEQLVKYGNEIIKKREENIREIEKEVFKKHLIISEKKEKIKIEYKKNVEENNFLKKLKEERENDIKNNITSVGPHRDDIKFYINDMDIKKYGSQGQQRTISIALKFAEVENIKNKKNESPIFLLDDVFSELDENRQKIIVENVNEMQTIITCTGIPIKILKILKPNRIIKIDNGKAEIKK